MDQFTLKAGEEGRTFMGTPNIQYSRNGDSSSTLFDMPMYTAVGQEAVTTAAKRIYSAPLHARNDAILQLKKESYNALPPPASDNKRCHLIAAGRQGQAFHIVHEEDWTPEMKQSMKANVDKVVQELDQKMVFTPKSTSPWPNSMCVNCGKSCLFRCSRCKLAFYCSHECQRKVGKVHNRTCVRLPEEPLLTWQVKYPKKWTEIAALLFISEPSTRAKWVFLQEVKQPDGTVDVTGILNSKEQANTTFYLIRPLVDLHKLKKAIQKVYADPQTIGFVVDSTHSKYSLCVVICNWDECTKPKETIDIARTSHNKQRILPVKQVEATAKEDKEWLTIEKELTVEKKDKEEEEEEEED